MLINLKPYSERIIKWLLFSTAFVPLLFSNKFLYPYLTQKLFFVRGVIVLTLALAIIYFFCFRESAKSLISNAREKTKKIPKLFFIFSGIFVVSQILSTVFSEFPYRAFWGTLERGAGLFNLFHFIIFSILLIMFFSKDDFGRYFKLSLVTGFIVYFYGFLQALNFVQFPFALVPDLRPGSFLGNGAFLSAYAFFVMISAIFTLWFSKNKEAGSQKFWFSLSIITLALTPVMIFLTRTRGALLGLFVSVLIFLIYFSFVKSSLSIKIFGFNLTDLKIKKFSKIALTVLIFLGLILFLTREASFWQKIPGFDRITQTISSFNRGASADVRLLGWKLAAKAFLEKPIFGWGPEHFIVAYERRYDPAFDAYGEVWLDRSHNSLFDVAATQGILGLIGYVGFLIIFLSIFFRAGPNFYLRLFSGTIFIGFLAQNFFLLEEFHVFVPFFVLVAAVISGFLRNEERSEEIIKNSEKGNFALATISGSFLVFVLTIFFLYKTVFVPTAQAHYVFKAQNAQTKEDFLNFYNKATNPYNFLQYSVRSYLFDFFYANQGTIFTDPRFDDVGNKLVSGIKELLEKERSYDIRSHIRLSQAYYEFAKQNPPTKDPLIHYRAGEEILKEALKISPNKQEIIYGLGFALAGQGHYDEALALMEKSIASNPEATEIARLHYYYGLILVSAGRERDAFQAFQKMRSADPALTRFSANDMRGLFAIYESMGESETILEIVRESAEGSIQAKIDLPYYEVALSYYLNREDGEAIITVAKFIANKFNERKEDMETIIDLVRKGEWAILKTL